MRSVKEMAADHVVLYFEKQEDALLFALAASSVMSSDATNCNHALANIADKICKATRITAKGALNIK
jgi:hypothetical protein